VDASEDPVHLEDEVFSVQGREGWSRCREEEIPQRCGRICPGFITADVSPTRNPNKEWKKSKAKICWRW
jgi:hypothetical protein